MPKYCSVPNCRTGGSVTGGDRRSFYKFPLSDPVRLQAWLSNMGREGWIPSRHQYICHQHFAPSCFKVRWGIRYLESDAVPTIFHGSEKRKATDHGERKSKWRREDQSVNVVLPDDGTAVDGGEATLPTLHLYEITLDPSLQGDAALMDAGDVGGLDASLRLHLSVVTAAEGGEGEQSVAPIILQTVEDAGDLAHEQQTQLMVMPEVAEQLGATILSQSHELLTQDLAPIERETQVVAYFETIPNVLPAEASARLVYSPDTVLSSALSSTPITSTLPIVSKHSPPASLQTLAEKVYEDAGAEGDPDDGELDEEEAEPTEMQLDEHSYHRSSLSREQLEAIVAELQKKVKVLQQRHRRHLEKLLGLENTVSQLRQSNLLNEERLQLLERAYVQTSVAVSEAGETVAIIYEEDPSANAATFLYTPLTDASGTL